MNDQQLIDLVRQTPPLELSSDDLQLLRARLAQSAALRRALGRELRLEQGLAELLDSGHDSAREILRRAPAVARRRAWRAAASRLLGLAVLLLLLAWIGLQWVLPGMTGRRALELSRLADGLRPASPAAIDRSASPAGDARRSPRAAAADEGAAAYGDDSGAAPVRRVPAARGIPREDRPAQPPNEGASTPPRDRPADGRVDAAAVELPLWIEAEDFARGTVTPELLQTEPEQVRVIRGAGPGSLAEYDVQLPAAGEYVLRLRYASLDSRPLLLTINGRRWERPTAGQQTGGYLAQHLRWFTEGTVSLAQGGNVIRLEAAGGFPHLDQLQIAVVGSPEPEPPLAAAGPSPAEPAASPAPGEPPPWSAAQLPPADLPAWRDVALAEFPDDRVLPDEKQLRQWFQAAPGAGLAIRASSAHGNGAARAVLAGPARLQAPWTEDSTLKLSLDSLRTLQVHIYHGTTGVTLVGGAEPFYRWSAYVTTRQPGKLQPDSYALAATDDDRSRRSGFRDGDPLHLHYRNHEILLSRGEVVLLRAPLPGLPDDVYFVGAEGVRGIDLVGSRGFAPRPEPLGGAAVEHQPAALDWQEPSAGQAELSRAADGSVELASHNANHSVWVAAPLPSAGGPELVVFEIDEASPGSGIFLGNGQAPPVAIVRVCRDRDTGRACLAWKQMDESFDAALPGLNEQPASYVAGRFWVRLLCGVDHMKCWLSPDGEHWGGALEPRAWDPSAQPATHVGLCTLRGVSSCRIRLRRVQRVPLEALAALAPADLLSAAPALGAVSHVTRWRREVAAARPQDADAGAWQRAAALRTLAGGCRWHLAKRLLEQLLDDVLTLPAPPALQRRRLDQAALLVDAWGEAARVSWMHDRYVAAAQELDRAGDLWPFTRLRNWWTCAPLWTREQLPAPARELCGAEVSRLAHTGRWASVRRLYARARFYRCPEDEPLLDWAAAMAWLQDDRVAAPHDLKFDPQWRPPLVPDLGKPAFDFRAELDAAIESGSFEDACRMITTVDTSSTAGLAPAALDPDLLVVPQVAAALAVAEHPRLRAELERRSRDPARLQLRRALADGDAAAVEQLLARFPGVPVLAEAHQWLGDQALATGDVPRALGAYRRGLALADEASQPQLAARQRLAGALCGRDLGQPPQLPVTWQAWTLAPQEFEALVQEMRSRHAAQTAGQAERLVGGEAPAPRGYQHVARARLDGQLGDGPSQTHVEKTRKHAVDWIGQQLATAVAGDTLYVSNRFQVAAYSLSDGKRLWQSRPLAEPRAASDAWPLVPMVPRVTPRHVIVRQLSGRGPALVCLDRASGQTVWYSVPDAGAQIASDPLLLGGRIVALTMSNHERPQVQLRLATFDPDSGLLVSQQPLLLLDTQALGRHASQLAASDDLLVGVVRGAVVACDSSRGQVRWIRRQIAVPGEVDRQSMLAYFGDPLIEEGRIYVTQPGLHAVECLDLDTGRLVWRTALPDLRRLLGIVAGQLLVETAAEVRSLHAQDGRLSWRLPTGKLMVPRLAGGDGGLLVCQRAAVKEIANKEFPRLVWIDPVRGQFIAAASLTALASPDSFLGPIVRHGDRLWAFFGQRTYGAADRDLIELVPHGDAEPLDAPAD